MKKVKFIDNISALQFFQLLRFTVFLIISIIFTKSYLTKAEIGEWEMFLFIASLLSFFWVTGIIQALLPMYHRNRTYRRVGENNEGKSPEIFNAFILLCLFSLLFFLIGFAIRDKISIFGFSGRDTYINLLLIYILLSNPVCLIEYIYLLNNKASKIVQYGFSTFTLQLILIIAPIIAGKELIWSFYGLLIITIIRWIWLIVLLRRYSEMKISIEFLKEHLYLGLPLILTSLISGSAQYIDGIIVSAYYRSPEVFANFRYGAKEFPLVLMLATGLSNAMLPEFSTRSRMKESLAKLKFRSEKLMHLLFPSSMVVMLFTRWLFPRLFTPEFVRSADIFLIYLLLVIPRLVFPQTIVIGRKKTRIAMIAAIVELIINIPLSLLLIGPYGTVGVALATFIVYCVEKIFLIWYVWAKMRIKPSEYIPIKVYITYTFLIVFLFVLIDHRIIDIQ
ncbi:MAG TPA: polysaccharide biosynthesis C-terminal domain-containing protein [Bacteroidales bacterium]|nr:polysaccharide biosynthesis C-terminal domain-containing protein [Bacteroidales bacterium]HQG36481.1 polysaccharide biosynthesis C-terminal domain-containing protein [Bacteroidales bacterium]HQG52560.1 polysaccharide biosynthesis C-terminal domain-containing protein [Bacteroidales bacterium]HQJ20482.1 polysaccharide biosynthesis C-terminal domain-containing protein [Bacteroidales bacterium]